MLIYNADVKHWFTGGISRSVGKRVCVPGLNCYSCPGAIASCPLGALQNTLAGGRLPFFMTGFLLLTGTLVGRMVCAFFCPFGLLQDLLYKIPAKKLRRTAASRRLARKLSIAKYIILALLCIVLPLVFYFKDGQGRPFFCSWFCPSGTIFAGIPLVLLNERLRESIGWLFTWKTAVALVIACCSIVIFRPFCRFFCPLGAIYSFFNRYAIFGIHLDKEKCTNCGACTASCKMDVLRVNDRECIRCGECKKRCHCGALT